MSPEAILHVMSITSRSFLLFYFVFTDCRDIWPISISFLFNFINFLVLFIKRFVCFSCFILSAVSCFLSVMRSLFLNCYLLFCTRIVLEGFSLLAFLLFNLPLFRFPFFLLCPRHPSVQMFLIQSVLR